MLPTIIDYTIVDVSVLYEAKSNGEETTLTNKDQQPRNRATVYPREEYLSFYTSAMAAIPSCRHTCTACEYFCSTLNELCTNMMPVH